MLVGCALSGWYCLLVVHCVRTVGSAWYWNNLLAV